MIQHIVFFLALAVPIVVIGAFYAEEEDGPAFRGIPMRYLRFVGACGLVAIIMLVLEYFFVSS